MRILVLGVFLSCFLLGCAMTKVSQKKATRLAIGHCGCSDIECLSQDMVRFDLPKLDKEVFRDMCTGQNKGGNDE
jgi:hypothetical protein